ncbi:MAG TPA: hypothetical protein VK919_05510 [Solirubrobacterales bacterium]|nr:hypothetical protein [Solirubrobacterales bacterium]
MAKKDEEAVEQEDGAQVEEDDSPALSITVHDDLVIVEVPRDGNEANALKRISGLVDGL